MLVLVAGGLLRGQTDSAPDANQQQALIAKIKQSAMRFQGQLPDFICTKLTARWEDSSGDGKKWKQRDSLEETVYFAQDGRTTINLLKLNGRPSNLPHRQLPGMIEDGILGASIVPAPVFSPAAPAQFQWSRWETREGRRMAVFAFQVAPWVQNLADRVHPWLIGFHGLVYADPSDGMVLRLELHDDGPPGYPLQDSGWDVDYGSVTISGRELILPVKAVSRERIGRLLQRNEIQFTGYRKYEADSTVKFGDNN